MKKRMLSVLVILVLCMSLTVSVFAADQQVLLDEADLLRSAEEAALVQELEKLGQLYNTHVVVMTVPSTYGNGDVDAYVESVYDTNGFGYGENHDGVLLLVCMDPREYRILSNGFAAGAISMDDIDSIGDAIVSDLSAGYYADAFQIFADECAHYLDGHINGFPFAFGRNLVIALIIGLIVGLIVALVLKGQLKSVYKQDRATNYVKSGSMQVTVARDFFLYRNVTRTKKETSNSSRSGSGSSRNVGGGSF